MSKTQQSKTIADFRSWVLNFLSDERDQSLKRAADARDNKQEWTASAWAFVAERLQKIIEEVREVKEPWLT